MNRPRLYELNELYEFYELNELNELNELSIWPKILTGIRIKTSLAKSHVQTKVQTKI